MISFQGVTPAPTSPAEPPTQAQRMAVEAPAPQVDAPKLNNQPPVDTVQFSSK